MAESSRKPRRRHQKPYQPAIGTDFGSVRDFDAEARHFLARFIAVASGIAVAVAGLFSLYSGNYVPIAAVWAVTGPIVGAVVTYYFGKRSSAG